jgi:hypothetical protein
MLWSNQTQSARMSILYITVGAIIDVWTATYYFFVLRPASAEHADRSQDWFWVAGFFFTGLALLIIGIFLGQIGRAAGKAEVAPATTGPITTSPAPVAATNSLPVEVRPQQMAPAPAQSVVPVA